MKPRKLPYRNIRVYPVTCSRLDYSKQQRQMHHSWNLVVYVFGFLLCSIVMLWTSAAWDRMWQSASRTLRHLWSNVLLVTISWALIRHDANSKQGLAPACRVLVGMAVAVRKDGDFRSGVVCGVGLLFSLVAGRIYLWRHEISIIVSVQDANSIFTIY